MPAHPPTRRRLLGTLAATAGAALLPGRLTAQTTLDVTGPEAFGPAIAAATPGTVLRLAPGDYNDLILRGAGGVPGAPVTLTAANPARPPVFSGMDLRDVNHLVLEALHFDYTFATDDEIWLQPFSITGSSGVILRACLFDGDKAQGVSAVDDGFGWGVGLGLRVVRDVVVEGCEIRDFHRGLMVRESDNLTIRGNDLHDLRMDGMNFAQVRLVTISANHIHNFNRSLDSQDHADMIQFWTEGTDAPSGDIMIRGNLLESGQGAWTQSIFMRNELVDTGRAGHKMFYRNVVIEENVISNAHLHGISVGETDGLTIRNNTLLRNAKSAGAEDNPMLWTPAINVAVVSRDVTILSNIAGRISGDDGQADWRVANNLVVQDRTRMEPNFYGKVFTGSPADIVRLRYRRGGPADGIGAARLQPG